MNNNTSNHRCWLARVAVTVSVSAIFAAAWAQDYDYDGEAADIGAPAQSEEAPTAPAQPAQYTTGEPVAAAPDDAENGQPADVTGETDVKRPAGKTGRASAPTPIFSKPNFELGLGVTTVDGKPWSYLALGADIPIWKFGVFLDVELFLTDKWKLSNMGWDFKDNTAEAVLRKIRYIRYGQEDEPLFVKFGGLENVTMGYGMIVDRFTNMLYYPGEKLHGLQVYVNDVSPIGLTVQTLISDFAEAGDDGGLYAARLAVHPLKMTELFLLDGLSVGGMYAIDANVRAPARTWKLDDDEAYLWENRDSIKVINNIKAHSDTTVVNIDTVLKRLAAEDSLRNGTSSFALYGFDITLPVVSTDILEVDIYTQFAFRADAVAGHGIGAPGVAVRLWNMIYGQVEFRNLGGRFMPEYFDTYYLEERYSRASLKSKNESLSDVSLNGIFGRAGGEIFGIINLSGTYQHMVGKNNETDSSITNRYYEAKASLGEAVLDFIPKINLAEVYVRNSDIGTYDKYKTDGSLDLDENKNPKKAMAFDRSPGMYLGYRAGIEIMGGLSIIGDYRYGWKEETNKIGIKRLVSDDHWQIHAAMRF